MKTNSNEAGLASAPNVIARRFAAAAEAALVDLLERFPAGIGAVELAQAEGIRAAAARLLECADRLARDGLMIAGSTRQLRPHQLLKTEQELRREVAEGLQKLAIRAEQQALYEQARALSSKGGERR
jgi:hypothetical protein